MKSLSKSQLFLGRADKLFQNLYENERDSEKVTNLKNDSYVGRLMLPGFWNMQQSYNNQGSIVFALDGCKINEIELRVNK